MHEKSVRYIVEIEDADQMIRLYNNGMSMSDIAYILNYNRSTVKSVIKSHTGKYLEQIVKTPKNTKEKDHITGSAMERRKTEEEINNEVLRLYDNGVSIPNIITKLRSVCNSEVKQILVDAGRIKPDYQTHKSITSKGIDSFIKTVNPGDKFKIRLNGYGYGKAITVSKLYKRFVTTTDNESFTYVDLYIGQRITDDEDK